jgi:hypothetical protein
MDLYSSLSYLVKFIVVTFSPRKRDQNKLEPDRDLWNIDTVVSARAIEKGTPSIFFSIASYEKIIRTSIYPINV